MARKNQPPHSEQLRLRASPVRDERVMARAPIEPKPPHDAATPHSDSKERDDTRYRFEKTLTVLRTQLELLKAAQCSRPVLDTYARLMAHLSSLDEQQIKEILSSPGATLEASRPVTPLSENDIKVLSLAKVEDLLKDAQTPRRTLERVAAIRFFMTRSELSAPANREALIEKMQTLIENERTRITIQKLASGTNEEPPQESDARLDDSRRRHQR